MQLCGVHITYYFDVHDALKFFRALSAPKNEMLLVCGTYTLTSMFDQILIILFCMFIHLYFTSHNNTAFIRNFII